MGEVTIGRTEDEEHGERLWLVASSAGNAWPERLRVSGLLARRCGPQEDGRDRRYGMTFRGPRETPEGADGEVRMRLVNAGATYRTGTYYAATDEWELRLVDGHVLGDLPPEPWQGTDPTRQTKRSRRGLGE